MPSHDIELSVPVKALKNVDTEIVVKSAGRRLGILLVSQGSVDWDPAGRRQKVSVSWEDFADLMNNVGKDGDKPRRRDAARGPRATASTAERTGAVGLARRRRRPGASPDVDISAIREWARVNGYAVGDRGRIRSEIQEAYRAAQ